MRNVIVLFIYFSCILFAGEGISTDIEQLDKRIVISNCISSQLDGAKISTITEKPTKIKFTVQAEDMAQGAISPNVPGTNLCDRSANVMALLSEIIPSHNGSGFQFSISKETASRTHVSSSQYFSGIEVLNSLVVFQFDKSSGDLKYIKVSVFEGLNPNTLTPSVDIAAIKSHLTTKLYEDLPDHVKPTFDPDVIDKFSFNLAIYRSFDDLDANLYTDKLVWVVSGGSRFIIDAVTGEILKTNDYIID